MLIAEAVPEFEADAQDLVRGEALQSLQLDHQHVPEGDPGDDDEPLRRVVVEHVAVVQVLGARQRDRQLDAALAGLAQTALGRLPLLQHQRIDPPLPRALLPDRIAEVTELVFDEDHSSLPTDRAQARRRRFPDSIPIRIAA